MKDFTHWNSSAGVGWGMIVMSFMVALYYNMIIAWTLYYFFASMTSQLPWELCDAEWNTPLCASVRGAVGVSPLFFSLLRQLG